MSQEISLTPKTESIGRTLALKVCSTLIHTHIVPETVLDTSTGRATEKKANYIHAYIPHRAPQYTAKWSYAVKHETKFDDIRSELRTKTIYFTANSFPSCEKFCILNNVMAGMSYRMTVGYIHLDVKYFALVILVNFSHLFGLEIVSICLGARLQQQVRYTRWVHYTTRRASVSGFWYKFGISS